MVYTLIGMCHLVIKVKSESMADGLITINNTLITYIMTAVTVVLQI